MSILYVRIAEANADTTVDARFRLDTGETVVGATVQRGDIEIRWSQGLSGEITACLTVQEARVLHRQLTVILDEFTGIDNEVEDQGTADDAGSSWPAPEWVRQARTFGIPSMNERAAIRESRSWTTGPEGVA